MGSGSYSHECKKPNCTFCYEMRRLELLKQPKPEPTLKPIIIKKYKYPRVKSAHQPHYKWTLEEKELLLTLLDIPTQQIVLQGLFNKRTYSSIDCQKSILRKEYGIKPKKRDMRIYHQ